MPIIYHETSRNFHLYNEKMSYIFTILKNGQLGQLYVGKRLKDRECFLHCVRIHGSFYGEIPDRGKSVTGFVDAGYDILLNTLHQL